MRPASWPIGARIVVAGIMGTSAPVLAFVTRAPDLLTCYAMSIGCRMWTGASPQNVVELLLGSLVLTQLVLVLTAPLIVIAVVAGLIFRRSIARHLLPWSLASPIAVWMFICVVEALWPHNNFLKARSFSERLWIHVVSVDNLLYLFGALVAGLAFYAMSAIGRGSPAPRSKDTPPRGGKAHGIVLVSDRSDGGGQCCPRGDR